VRIDPLAVKTVGFAGAAARRRAATYRERAADVLKIARGESTSKLRCQLLDLSKRYSDLAETLEMATATIGFQRACREKC
jgi:hypothetical protein